MLRCPYRIFTKSKSKALPSEGITLSTQYRNFRSYVLCAGWQYQSPAPVMLLLWKEFGLRLADGGGQKKIA